MGVNKLEGILPIGLIISLTLLYFFIDCQLLSEKFDSAFVEIEQVKGNENLGLKLPYILLFI